MVGHNMDFIVRFDKVLQSQSDRREKSVNGCGNMKDKLGEVVL